MFGIENYYVFIVTAFIFVMTPGVDTVFVLNQSIGKGSRSGVYSTIGINCGVLVHTLFAALGLSFVIAQSALAFSVMKYLGAAYLFYLGIRAIWSKGKIQFDQSPIAKKHSAVKSFRTGFITNILNPKVALFFLSFFPQFIQTEYLQTPVPFFILGATYALLGMCWFLALTYFSALFSDKLKQNPLFSNRMNKISGFVYILMGIKIALTRR